MLSIIISPDHVAIGTKVVKDPIGIAAANAVAAPGATNLKSEELSGYGAQTIGHIWAYNITSGFSRVSCSELEKKNITKF
jgi:hypothetical protein